MTTYVFLLLFLCTNLPATRAFAQDYDYSAKVYPISQRYVAKPDFKPIESRITIQNTGDDAFFKIATQFEESALEIKLLYLDNNQKWSRVNQPIFIKSKASKIIMVQIQPVDKLEERDYVVETNVSLLPAYTPLTSSKYLQIEPRIKTKIVVSSTQNGLTSIRAKIAYFTNLNGMVILSDQSPKIVLLIQNLNKHSLDVEGVVDIRKDNKLESTSLIPITIEANNQSNLTNTTGSEYIHIGDNLPWGKYELSAKIKTGQPKEPTIFANYTLWVLPHVVLYPFVGSLIIVLLVSFFYHFLNFKHG